MTQQLRKNAGCWLAIIGVILSGILTGCQTGSKGVDASQEAIGRGFHKGDTVVISYISNEGTVDPMPPVAQRIGEDGNITLMYVGSVAALGKTAAELQKTVHDLYVPKYFTELNVAVKSEIGFFYVDGEVQQRGAKEFPGDMTIVKAITAAGGFTDFAKQTKVRLTRGNHTQIINVKKAVSDPKYDVPVFPGDKIHVPRRLLW